MSCPYQVFHNNGLGFVNATALVAPPSDGYLAVTGSGTVYFLGTSQLVSVVPETVTRYALPSGFSGRAMWAAGPNDVFVVCLGGRIYRFDGATFTAMTTPTTADLTAVWGSAANDVYVGGQGVVLHFDGSTWSTEPAGLTTERVSSVSGSTVGAPVYVVANGKVLKGVR